MEGHSLKGMDPMCCYSKKLGIISNILQTKKEVDIMASSKSMVMSFYRKTMALEKVQRQVAKAIK